MLWYVRNFFAAIAVCLHACPPDQADAVLAQELFAVIAACF
jgi:hypothetical protein